MRHTSYKGFGIAQRLQLVCGALSLAFTGVALFAYFNLNYVTQVARQTESLRVHQLQRVSATERKMTRVLLLLQQSILARNADELKRQLDGMGDKRQQITRAKHDYQQDLMLLPLV